MRISLLAIWAFQAFESLPHFRRHLLDRLVPPLPSGLVGEDVQLLRRRSDLKALAALGGASPQSLQSSAQIFRKVIGQSTIRGFPRQRRACRGVVEPEFSAGLERNLTPRSNHRRTVPAAENAEQTIEEVGQPAAASQASGSALRATDLVFSRSGAAM